MQIETSEGTSRYKQKGGYQCDVTHHHPQPVPIMSTYTVLYPHPDNPVFRIIAVENINRHLSSLALEAGKQCPELKVPDLPISEILFYKVRRSSSCILRA